MVVILYAVASGLTAVIQDIEQALVFAVISISATVGWFLAFVPLADWMTAVFGLLLGFEYLLIRVGRLGDSILGIIRATSRFAYDFAIWYWTENPPDFAEVPQLYWDLWGDVSTLVVRMGQWIVDIFAGEGVFDPVGAALTWGFGIWFCGLWAGWVTKRHHSPVIGVLPGGALLAFVISYTGENPYVLLPVVGISLILLALMQHSARETKWEERDTDFSNGLWSDILVVATGISIGLVVLSAIAPSITVERISEWVREITASETESEGSVAESLGLEPKPEPVERVPLDDVRSTGLPRQHLIGSGPELSREVVMVIETGELAAVPDITTLGVTEAPGHYWRSLTYDWYFGRGWSTRGTEETEYEAGEVANPFDPEEDPNYRRVRQTVRFVGEDMGWLIYVSGELMSVDQPYQVSWRWGDEVFAATTEATTYRADSFIPVVTEEALRSASTDYPDGILDRYLQLPDDVPERVKSLARDLTATPPTPYDRAKAIEAYLREFPYTLNVPQPGLQENIADFFLFELQEGYCDYYATSMVVLARSAGLPARLVVGYITGTYDSTNARYIVTEADAHAWPEIYFPGYGWIEFEPTGGRPPIDRPGSEEDEIVWPEDSELEPLVDSGVERAIRDALTVGEWLLIGLGSILGFILLASGIDGLVLLTLGTSHMLLSRIYARLRRFAERLRADVDAGYTPYELEDALQDRIEAISQDWKAVKWVLEPSVDEIDLLIESYVKRWYSQAPEMTQQARRKVVATWWALRWRLWLARVLRNPRSVEDLDAGEEALSLASESP
jgi:transglutaminase-like putative cysteine protease